MTPEMAGIWICIGLLVIILVAIAVVGARMSRAHELLMNQTIIQGRTTRQRIGGARPITRSDG